MLSVIGRHGATRAFLGVAILVGATLLSPVDSRAAGASALKKCRGPVTQNPDPTVANSLMSFEATSCSGTSCSPNLLAPNSTPTGARSVSTTDRTASDGTLGGPDTMVCTVQEVINLSASGCAIPTQGVCTSGVCTAGRVGPPAAACAKNSECSVLNEVTDNNAMSGNVDATA